MAMMPEAAKDKTPKVISAHEIGIDEECTARGDKRQTKENPSAHPAPWLSKESL